MKIDSPSELKNLYPAPGERALKKELSALDEHARNFIAHSPFFVIATSDTMGNMDNSPRGGKPGFVRIISDTQIVFCDAKGNNRLDSLSNIAGNGRVGLLFLIPGIDETLRLNGSAEISTEQELLGMFSEEQNSPKTAIVVNVESVYLHCAKAFMRSELWNPEKHLERTEFPTMGQMLKDQIKSDVPPESHDVMVKRYKSDL
jgi:PPOX class probable FMN-dependent enzyme